MASKPSKTTPTSTILRPDPISQPENIVPGQNQKNSEEDQLPLPIKPQNTIPTEENQGDTPHTSTTTSGSTYTMTVSSNPGETTTITTIANTAESSTLHAEWKKTTSVVSENYKTSGRIMRKRVEQGLPNQAITLFAPIGMAEDLTKVQLILCNEIKTEIQAVKNIITTIHLKRCRETSLK